MKIVLIGSGDFAEQIIDISSTIQDIQIIGVFDGNKPKGSLVSTIPVLGDDTDVLPLYKQGFFDSIFISIGYAKFVLKQRLYDIFVRQIPMATIIHPSAIIHPTAKIGSNVLIHAGVIIDKGCIVEDNVTFMPGVLMSHNSHICKHSFIAGRTAMAGCVSVGERTFVGLNSCIRDHVTIGHDCVIGMGSVVINNVPDYNTVVGNPGKSIKIKNE